MNKALLIISFIFLIIYSCSNDDSPSDDSFLSSALTSATNKQLEGRWAIFQVQFDGETTDIPVSIAECGRDFFDFQPQGEYIEYIFIDSYECSSQINILSWTLSNGIISLSNDMANDIWVITELTSNRLVFKFQLDIDSDGDLEIFKAICNRYEPPKEMDIYSGTFHWDNSSDNLDKIFLKWNGYKGYNKFEKYEIYRLNENCDSSNPVLISTITDINQATFIDETPPIKEEICYLFKIYTNEGLLGESDAVAVNTSSIIVPVVNLSVPLLNNDSVEFDWGQYEGYYFSHYEIEAKNYLYGSGGGYQEEQLAIINEISTLNTSLKLPYFSNPVFTINVYNIFGTRSQFTIEGQNQRSTNFIRKEIVPINFIKFADFSPNESILYYSDYSKLYRYNYNTNSVENSVELNSSSIVFVKVFESSYGIEVIANIGGTLKVYDANLNFKYNLTSTLNSLEHMILNADGYWLITDRKSLHSFSRTNNNLVLISSNNLYNQLFSVSTINILDIGNNKVLAGNHTQSQGLIVNIDANGVLSNATLTNLNLTSQWKNNSLFSNNKQYLLNLEDKTLYSTNTFNLITTLNQNYFPSGISNDGLFILGTNNNPKYTSNSLHEKKIRILSYPNLNEQIYNTNGYPIVVFQNHLEQWVSISKGLVGSLESSSPQNDIFIEVIE